MPTQSILIVDDEIQNFDVIDGFLRTLNYQLYYASNGHEALEMLPVLKPDLMLLDVMMPSLSGIETCQQVRAMPKFEALPIIMVTALTSKNDLAKCLSAGADDFISKPVNRLELHARVRSMLRINRQYRQLQSFNEHLEQTVQQRTVQLQSMIMEDALTRLPSHTAFRSELAQSLLHQTSSSVAMVHLSCDDLQLVNSSFGHTIGSQLLISIARRLRQYVPNGSILARYGEDEFSFLLRDFNTQEEINRFVQLLMQAFEAPFTVQDCEIYLSASIGIVLIHGDNQLPDEIIQNANIALYQAKLKGKGKYQFFEQEMHRTMLHRLTLESDLQRAYRQGEFFLQYQPIVNLQKSCIAGFEALVRWQHPTRGLVSPNEFIPSMETTGLIIPVGMIILEQACQQLAKWQRLGWDDLFVSVNVSVRQFSSSTLLSDIDNILAKTAIAPSCLKLEITESAIIDDVDLAVSILEALRDRDIQLCIDDFGTGYSSLGCLHQFPIDYLKIDRSFVNQIQLNYDSYHVVDSIIALSKQLKLAAIAEGIETEQQLERLQRLGCEFGQGYLFSKPLAASKAEQQYLTLSQDSSSAQKSGYSLLLPR